MKLIVLSMVVITAGCASDGRNTKRVPDSKPTQRPVARPAPVIPRAPSINSGIEPAEAVWHLRSALNVAALSCRRPAHRAITANYNAMLKQHRVAMARGLAAERQEHPTDYDRHATRVYNYFAGLAIQPQFCPVALAQSVRAKSATTPEFERFSVAALAEIERATRR